MWWFSPTGLDSELSSLTASVSLGIDRRPGLPESSAPNPDQWGERWR